MLAATVCPTSIWRSTTTPETGERITEKLEAGAVAVVLVRGPGAGRPLPPSLPAPPGRVPLSRYILFRERRASGCAPHWPAASSDALALAILAFALAGGGGEHGIVEFGQHWPAWTASLPVDSFTVPRPSAPTFDQRPAQCCQENVLRDVADHRPAASAVSGEGTAPATRFAPAVMTTMPARAERVPRGSAYDQGFLPSGGRGLFAGEPVDGRIGARRPIAPAWRADIPADRSARAAGARQRARLRRVPSVEDAATPAR